MITLARFLFCFCDEIGLRGMNIVWVHTACQHKIWIAVVIAFEEILSLLHYWVGTWEIRGVIPARQIVAVSCWFVGCDEASGQWGRFMHVFALSFHVG